MGKKRLRRYKQCAKCPWKATTNPHEIPHGYSCQMHAALRGTIAEPGSIKALGAGHQRVMACHESPVGREAHCLGWLMHQLGPGNNIALRFAMLDYDLSKVVLDGPQHERFEDTLPPEVRL